MRLMISRKFKTALWPSLLFMIHSASFAYGQCISSLSSVSGDASQANPGTPLARVVVDEISLRHVGIDRIQLALSLKMSSSQNSSLRQIAFEGMRLNGLPFYAAPISERIKLSAGVPLLLPQPVMITFYYRDLDTLHPLERLVSEQRMVVDGAFYVDVELNLVEQALLVLRRARIKVAFREEIPLQIPGGETARKTALNLLGAAESARKVLGSEVEYGLKQVSQSRQKLWSDYSPAMLLAQVHFAIINNKGAKIVFDCSGAGFRIAPRQFILTKQLAEPWKFDPEIAALLQLDGFELDRSQYDFTIWPASVNEEKNNPSQVLLRLSQSQGLIRLLREPKDENVVVFLPRNTGHPARVRVHRTDSTANVTVFEVTASADRFPGSEMKLDTHDSSDLPSGLAAFRFPPGASSENTRPDLVFIEATRKGSKIDLSTRLDSGGWGSALIGPDGVVGIVQGEDCALSTLAALQALGIDGSFPSPSRTRP